MPDRRFYSKKITCPDLKDDGHNHVVFRKSFEVGSFETAKAFVISDGCCELYVNGFPVVIVPGDGQGHRADAGDYLMPGENVIALHVRFEDIGGGVRFELEVDGERTVLSDESFLCAVHDGFTVEHDIDGEIETFDSRSEYVGFESPYYEDGGWEKCRAFDADPTPVATVRTGDTVPKKPTSVKELGSVYSVNFDGRESGSLFLAAKGKRGSEVLVGTDRKLKIKWILSGDDDMLDLFRFDCIGMSAVRMPPGAVLEKDDIRLRLPGKQY